jgi:hypothetical protein
MTSVRRRISLLSRWIIQPSWSWALRCFQWVTQRLDTHQPSPSYPLRAAHRPLPVMREPHQVDGALAGLLDHEQDGQGRRVHSSLLSAAALLQARAVSGVGRPEFGALGVPLPAADGGLVVHRSLTPSAVTTALGVKDLADVPAAIAAQQVAESRQRASTRSEPALTRENSPMTRGGHSATTGSLRLRPPAMELPRLSQLTSVGPSPWSLWLGCVATWADEP